MRALALLLLLACGAPCEPIPCTRPATPNACSCGSRFCTVCVCEGAQCFTGNTGTVHTIDCVDPMQPTAPRCGP